MFKDVSANKKIEKRLEVLYCDIKDDVFKEGKDGALRLFLLGQIVSLEYILEDIKHLDEDI